MKRLICILLTLVLLAAMIPAFGENSSNAKEFDASFCNLLDLSITEWFATSYTRAMFTVLVMLDLMNSVDDFYETELSDGAWINKGTAVAKYGDYILHLYLNGTVSDIIVSYIPITGHGEYYTFAHSEYGSLGFDTVFGSLLLEDTVYYENNLSDLVEVTNDISEITG